MSSNWFTPASAWFFRPPISNDDFNEVDALFPVSPSLHHRHPCAGKYEKLASDGKVRQVHYNQNSGTGAGHIARRKKCLPLGSPCTVLSLIGLLICFFVAIRSLQVISADSGEIGGLSCVGVKCRGLPEHATAAELYKITNDGLYERDGTFLLGRNHRIWPPTRWEDEDFRNEFLNFIQKFGKKYDLTRSRERFTVFKDNLRLIHAHNLQAQSNLYGGTPTHGFLSHVAGFTDVAAAKIQYNQKFRMAPNEYTDLTLDEFSRTFLRMVWPGEQNATTGSPSQGFGPEVVEKRRTMWELAHVPDSSIPTQVDWVTRSCVTPVKDQSRCGSCWAFSTTGAIEGAICAKTGKLLNLSEQQLVDCSNTEGTHGCSGGFMDNAFRYVAHTGGLCSEEDYPYEGQEARCRQSQCLKVATIKSLMDIPPRNEKAVLAALSVYGPVSAGVEADKSAFQFYRDGVFNLGCGKKLNHAILIVGYGLDETSGEPFYLVKNSWGNRWGDRGFIRIARKHHGRAGECGILLAPSLPIV